MVLGNIRGHCKFLALLALDSVHLSVRDLQASVPAPPPPPITELQLGERVRGPKKKIEEGGQQSQNPLSRWQEQGKEAEVLIQRPPRCQDLQTFQSQFTHLKNRNKNTYHVMCCEN